MNETIDLWVWLIPIAATIAFALMAVSFVSSESSDNPLALGITFMFALLYLIPILAVWLMFFALKWIVASYATTAN